MIDWIEVHDHSGDAIYIHTDKIVAVEGVYKPRTKEPDGGFIRLVDHEYLTKETADEIMKQIMGIR